MDLCAVVLGVGLAVCQCHTLCHRRIWCLPTTANACLYGTVKNTSYLFQLLRPHLVALKNHDTVIRKSQRTAKMPVSLRPQQAKVTGHIFTGTGINGVV